MANELPILKAEFTGAHPPLDPPTQRAVLTAFRLLGEGEPLCDAELAERTGLRSDEIAAALGPSMVERDSEGRVIGLAGLTLEPTQHTLEVDGRALYAWCALDTLFLPELLDRPARVRSVCPETGEEISLAVDPSGVRDLSPAGAAMSLHDPTGCDPADVKATFCRHVHFFASEQAARAWAGRTEGTHVASVAEGFECGRISNHMRLGTALREADR